MGMFRCDRQNDRGRKEETLRRLQLGPIELEFRGFLMPMTCLGCLRLQQFPAADSLIEKSMATQDVLVDGELFSLIGEDDGLVLVCPPKSNDAPFRRFESFPPKMNCFLQLGNL